MAGWRRGAFYPSFLFPELRLLAFCFGAPLLDVLTGGVSPSPSSDLNDPKQKADYERGYQMLLDFFHKYL